VAGIAAISLAVAGILVMNVMLVSVSQRTAEIGLLKALGATGSGIRLVFLTEAIMLSLAGALVGYWLGATGRCGDPPALPYISRLPARIGPSLPDWQPRW
jgi:putative ABC transport system permease protein